MSFAKLFLQRHDSFYDFWLAGVWECAADQQMRERPHPRVTSIAWNIWHLTRAEDAAMSRILTDGQQVLDEGGWAERMKVPFRHIGGGMTYQEVDELNAAIDIAGLHGYSDAVRALTRKVVAELDPETLEAPLDPDRLRAVILREGLALRNAEEMLAGYSRWTRGNCLMTLGLTHPYQHMGTIGTISRLLGIEYE
ncbi:MAG: DinB family protein [Candidatus Eisenbacteria bacterium]